MRRAKSVERATSGSCEGISEEVSRRLCSHSRTARSSGGMVVLSRKSVEQRRSFAREGVCRAVRLRVRGMAWANRTARRLAVMAVSGVLQGELVVLDELMGAFDDELMGVLDDA